jgi:hypothetical protein
MLFKNITKLPIKIFIKEIINGIYEDNKLSNYQLSGQIGVKGFEGIQNYDNEFLSFTLILNNTKFILKVIYIIKLKKKGKFIFIQLIKLKKKIGNRK